MVLHRRLSCCRHYPGLVPSFGSRLSSTSRSRVDTTIIHIRHSRSRGRCQFCLSCCSPSCWLSHCSTISRTGTAPQVAIIALSIIIPAWFYHSPYYPIWFIFINYQFIIILNSIRLDIDFNLIVRFVVLIIEFKCACCNLYFAIAHSNW